MHVDLDKLNEKNEKRGIKRLLIGFFRGMSAGRVLTGFYFRHKFSYTSVCTGVVTMGLLFWMVMMVVATFLETYSKSFIDTVITNGGFQIKDTIHASNVASFMRILDPELLVKINDSDFCISHDI
jgi:hypothetical protein